MLSLRIRAWAIGLSGVAVVALTLGAAPDPVFRQIDGIVKVLSSITGFSEEHSVSYGRMNQRQLRRFLSKRIRSTNRPGEIEADELALKMLGFVPRDYDLRRSTLDLLTEQAAAFYDYDRKHLFILQNASVTEEAVTLAHELSHALADQHFNLGKFMDDKPANDDENLAHSAVVEGEACWLMLAYTQQVGGKTPEPTAEMLRSITGETTTGTGDSATGKDSNAQLPASGGEAASTASDFPVLSDAPLYIQQSLLFPYASGTAFFEAVYQRMHKAAFSYVFVHPPFDSAQILHPDRYFAHERSSKPELPAMVSLKPDDKLTEGSVGEFDHHMLLRQYIKNASADRLANFVRGGYFEVDVPGNVSKPVLRYASEWDSEQHADEFFELYGKILSGKWERLDIVVRNAVMLAGSGDYGFFITRRRGKLVTSIEGVTGRNEWEQMLGAK